MKLNRENIIKALECCKVGDDCWACPYDNVGVYSQCVPKLLEDALALIKSQEQRIEELSEETKSLTKTVKVRGETIEKLQFSVSNISEDNRKLTEENERLRAIPEQLHKEMSERMVEECKIARKLAVRKMQSEINKTLSALCKGDVGEIRRIIDQIAKEMLEENNGQG